MQNTFKTQSFQAHQSGNAMIYVLIVVALFAALTFVLSRQTDTSEAATLPAERASILASDILNTPFTYKQGLDMAQLSGSTANDLNFVLPTEAGFNDPLTANNIHKVYHPQGAGISPATLSTEAIGQGASPPDAGWYLGRFNNFEWSINTAADKQEVILTAYNIRREVCEIINKRLISDATIPTVSSPRNFFVDDLYFGGSGNDDLEIADCPACEGHLQLCISDGQNPTTYLYYNIMVNQ